MAGCSPSSGCRPHQARSSPSQGSRRLRRVVGNQPLPPRDYWSNHLQCQAELSVRFPENSGSFLRFVPSKSSRETSSRSAGCQSQKQDHQGDQDPDRDFACPGGVVQGLEPGFFVSSQRLRFSPSFGHLSTSEVRGPAAHLQLRPGSNHAQLQVFR